VSVRVGINGLGRIGRALLRLAHLRPELGVEIVAANDSADSAALARLLRHDTVHGPFPAPVAVANGALDVAGRKVPIARIEDPRAIDWAAHGVEIVVEATGKFRTRDASAPHLGDGVRRVVVSATIPDADATFCVGINDASFDPGRHQVVSNASCTTNCLAATLAAIHPVFGVERALMNTVHCVTNSQNLVDMAHPDPRRARAALANIIPTTSDAFPSIEWVMPELADAFRAAERGPLAGILGTTDEELVSSDFVDDPRSAVVDLPLLQLAGPRLVRVVAWYDNEWGYANRLVELLSGIAARGG